MTEKLIVLGVLTLFLILSVCAMFSVDSETHKEIQSIPEKYPEEVKQCILSSGSSEKRCSRLIYYNLIETGIIGEKKDV